MLQPMKLAQKVREFAGLNPWKMSQAMGKEKVQSYLSLERKAQRITLSDLLSLERIYIKAGGTKEQFDDLVRKCAKVEK